MGPEMGRREGSGGILKSMYNNTWQESAKSLEPSSQAQWCPMTGPDAMSINWNTWRSLWTSGNTFLLWGWPSTATGCQGSCGVSLLGSIQKSCGHGLGQPALSGPAWAGGLDYMTSRGLFLLQPFCDSVWALWTSWSTLESDFFWKQMFPIWAVGLYSPSLKTKSYLFYFPWLVMVTSIFFFLTFILWQIINSSSLSSLHTSLIPVPSGPKHSPNSSLLLHRELLAYALKVYALRHTIPVSFVKSNLSKLIPAYL